MLNKKTNLKILTINLDYTLAMDSPDFGDAQQRNIAYGQYVEKIISITHSPRKLGLKHKKLSDQVEIFPSSSKNPLFFLFDAFQLTRQIFVNYRMDLVLSQDPFITGLVAYLIKKRYGCAFLIHFHGDFWQNKYWLREKWYNFILLWLSKFLVKRADGIKVVSLGIKKKLMEAGIPEEKIRVIPTPVNLEKFEKFDQGKVKSLRNGGYPDKKVILNIGRQDPSKDYPTLYKAVELVYQDYKKLAFCQIGANIYLPKKIRADENLILISTAKIEQEKIIDYYHTADVYVSSSKHESFGKVLIEAMAAGLPIVATATTGSQEIVKDGINGFLVPIGDSKALAKKVLYLLNNPEKAKEMGENGRRMVKDRFNQEKIIEEIIKFWQDLCAS